MNSKELDKKALLKSVDKIGIHFSIDEEGFFVVNNFRIPYSDNPWIFKKFGSQTKDIRNEKTYSKTFSIDVAGAEHSYIEYGDGAITYKKNGSLHNKQGPAQITSRKAKYYFQEGKLHRLDGPAVEIPSKEPETYALDGKIYNLSGWIRNHPKAKINRFSKTLGGFVTTFAYKDYTIVSTGGHEFLLRKVKDDVYIGPEQILLLTLFKAMPGYEVVSFSSSSNSLRELFEKTKNVDTWDTYLNKEIFQLDATIKNGDFLTLELNHTDGWLGYRVYDKKHHLIVDEGSFCDVTLAESESMMNKKSYDLSDLFEDSDNKTEFVDDKTEFDKEIDRILEGLGAVLANEPPYRKKEDAMPEYADSEDISLSLFGLNVSKEAYTKALYDPSKDIYFWTDDNNEFHSFDSSTPAVIGYDGTIKYYEHGLLHNESGPAICNIHNRTISQHYIRGRKVSMDELVHYVPSLKTIEFRKDGELHREDGPALIVFHPDHTYTEHFYINGNKIDAQNNLESPFESAWAIEKDLGVKKDESAFLNFKDNVKQHYKKEEPMTVEKIKRGEPDLSGGRLSQIWEGSKFGAKKGVVNGSAKLMANKAVSYTPFEDSNWAEEFIKLIIIGGTGELIDIIPESAAENLNLDPYTQREIASFFRKLAGENLGRNAVNVVSGLIPYFKDIIMNFTAEDISLATEEYYSEASGALDSVGEHINFDDLVQNQGSSEEDVVEHVEEQQETVVHER